MIGRSIHRFNLKQFPNNIKKYKLKILNHVRCWKVVNECMLEVEPGL